MYCEWLPYLFCKMPLESISKYKFFFKKIERYLKAVIMMLDRFPILLTVWHPAISIMIFSVNDSLFFTLKTF